LHRGRIVRKRYPAGRGEISCVANGC
jgi:hypothetical protein